MIEYVSLKELANELGLDRSNMRKYVLKCGFDPVGMRTPDSGHQLTLVVTAADAELIRERRQSEGFGETSKPVSSNGGYFYLIQLVPELAPNRIKLGYATDTKARLDAHRTSAPTAILVKSWPCKRAWEPAAIASVTRTGCTLIASEVFECDNIGSTVERADAFFALLPS